LAGNDPVNHELGDGRQPRIGQALRQRSQKCSQIGLQFRNRQPPNDD